MSYPELPAQKPNSDRTLRSRFLVPLITVAFGAVLLAAGGFTCFASAALGRRPWIFLWAVLGGLIVVISGAVWLFVALIAWLISRKPDEEL